MRFVAVAVPVPQLDALTYRVPEGWPLPRSARACACRSAAASSPAACSGRPRLPPATSRRRTFARCWTTPRSCRRPSSSCARGSPTTTWPAWATPSAWRCRPAPRRAPRATRRGSSCHSRRTVWPPSKTVFLARALRGRPAGSPRSSAPRCRRWPGPPACRSRSCANAASPPRWCRGWRRGSSSPPGTRRTSGTRSRVRRSSPWPTTSPGPPRRNRPRRARRWWPWPAPAASRWRLLHGVTGSGKTEVYLRVARAVRDAGRQVLLLVPEIALTPSMSALVRGAFGERVAIQHSSLSDGERHDQWQRIRRGDVDIVVGTRSAVFAPLERARAHHRRRRARLVVQAGGGAALSRPRRGDRARAEGGRAGRARLCHALDGELPARRSPASTPRSR